MAPIVGTVTGTVTIGVVGTDSDSVVRSDRPVHPGPGRAWTRPKGAAVG